MSGLAVTGGVPIPLEEVRFALDSVAVPGFTGTLQLEIGLREEAARCVRIDVVRRQVMRYEAVDGVRHTLPDPERKKPVQSAITKLEPRLIIRPVLTAVEFHLANGVLQKWTIQE